jgi:hypothetical protein
MHEVVYVRTHDVSSSSYVRKAEACKREQEAKQGFPPVRQKAERKDRLLRE